MMLHESLTRLKGEIIVTTMNGHFTLLSFADMTR